MSIIKAGRGRAWALVSLSTHLPLRGGVGACMGV